jgi:predicted transcriptional regulator YdeE
MHGSPDFIELTTAREITGLTVRTSNARERDAGTALLPGLWGRFMAATAGVQSEPPAPVFSVYTDYESDANGEYTVVLGREAGPSPLEQRTVRVMPGRYAVFTSTGAIPAAVVAGWQEVWTYFARPGAPARAYTTDFEYYDPALPSTVRIHIAVRASSRDARSDL